ncbi:hypothetical protein V6N11_037668 [Hibiscus sabdariffa]|uniref:Uncharacterized protein n=1 Tax=Hibiscus sabdariffa TaxID=183260 RepID=A0ABR2PBY7_9ROSI
MVVTRIVHSPLVMDIGLKLRRAPRESSTGGQLACRRSTSKTQLDPHRILPPSAVMREVQVRRRSVAFHLFRSVLCCGKWLRTHVYGLPT